MELLLLQATEENPPTEGDYTQFHNLRVWQQTNPVVNSLIMLPADAPWDRVRPGIVAMRFSIFQHVSRQEH